ncbi:ArnT family glycosyltransferase [Solilutibacter silvestris]|uniref:Dolichyl-phosphate-mannose-protein mannosyltransferase n=1 Tax=Solilutibacter silvestris TaxID=1645665 RepID=A0A2K1Q0F2_9GAMM|nr:glycosyltransferase family 39 protein [Lysobacter silvestris]PNS08513.1 Dolichyl-phosphate-mannose-protein mannosyltransferase [Lysobacter silvestris]
MLKTRESRDTWLFWIAALLIVGAGIGLRDPWPADEPRFALAAKQMVESGDWLFPHRGIELYSDKPPMLMWLQATFFDIFRNWRVAFLLPSLLATLMTLACVKDLGKRLWTPKIGLWAAWAVLLAFQFTYQAKKAQIDPLVTGFITLANYGLLRHLLLGPNWRWWWIGWFAAGLGTITKGVGVLALLMLAPAIYASVRGWQSRGERMALHVRDWRFWIAPLFFVAAMALWLLPMVSAVQARHDPVYDAYLNDILFHQTAKRYAQSWDHAQPAWYFIVVIVGMWLPAMLALPWAIPAWRRRLQRHDARYLLPLVWGALMVVFFSIPSGKRDVYIMPVLPMWGLVLAPLLPGLLRKAWPRRLLAIAMSVMAIGFVAGGALMAFGHSKSITRFLTDRGLESGAGIGWMLLAMGAGVIVALAWWRRRLEIATIVSLGTMWILFSVFGYPLLNDSSSARGLMRDVGARIGPDAQLAMLGWKEQNLLMADRPAVNFGFTRDMQVQTADAIHWLQADPEHRWLLVQDTALPKCIPQSALELVPHANRRTWYLVRGGAAMACPH